MGPPGREDARGNDQQQHRREHCQQIGRCYPALVHEAEGDPHHRRRQRRFGPVVRGHQQQREPDGERQPDDGPLLGCRHPVQQRVESSCPPGQRDQDQHGGQDQADQSELDQFPLREGQAASGPDITRYRDGDGARRCERDERDPVEITRSSINYPKCLGKGGGRAPRWRGWRDQRALAWLAHGPSACSASSGTRATATTDWPNGGRPTRRSRNRTTGTSSRS